MIGLMNYKFFIVHCSLDNVCHTISKKLEACKIEKLYSIFHNVYHDLIYAEPYLCKTLFCYMFMLSAEEIRCVFADI